MVQEIASNRFKQGIFLKPVQYISEGKLNQLKNLTKLIIMKRQNKDGKSIYSDSVWNQMQEIGNNLLKIGYRESTKSPNLFYKPINDNSEKGRIYADLRGTADIPIWENPRPITYSYDISFNRYIKEVILMKRNDCKPRLTFYQRYEPDGWAFALNGIPNGYCKQCGKDIIHEVDWSILEGGLYYKDGHDKQGNYQSSIMYCSECLSKNNQAK